MAKSRDESDPESPDSQESAPKKSAGWLDDLARRSTGLPQDVRQSDKDRQGEGSLWKFAGLGLQFAGTTAFFTFVGYELDKKFGSSPWWTISLAMLAVIGSLYLLIKEAMTPPGPPKRK